MTENNEAINLRITRLNHLILGHSEATSKTVKSVVDGLCREGLLDVLVLLYNECNKDFLKKKDKNIFEFVNKYRDIIQETNNLRININDFCIKSLIGKGYFGDVYLASEKSTKDIYAIKKIGKSLIGTSSQVKEERDIMASNSSEWITSLQYAFQDQQCLYLVMEYHPGGDLLSLMIRNGAFDEELSKFYLAEMTMALNALHCMGFVHRDIKPENILLDRFGHLKLADFGNAAHLNKDGSVISISPVGTPDYIAPELLNSLSTLKLSKSVHDVTCDYWSMGVIGYEFITEVTPFHDDNVHETYSKILSHCESKFVRKLIYPVGIEVSTVFRDLIDNLIRKPSERLTYHQIIQHPYFKGIDWDNLRHQVPPIIPTLANEEDTSNFEDVDKKARRSTFNKTQIKGFGKGNDFSGQNLPFLGYSYVNENTQNSDLLFESNNKSSTGTDKLNVKIKELQITVDEQIVDIKSLQHNLLCSQRRNVQTEALEKILLEAKNEITNMKGTLKEKTKELAAAKTDVKTLKSSLQIEEEMRLKNDANISELLNSTYQKWEKAKKIFVQNYETQINENKTDISCLTQNLITRENELSAKVDECHHLQERVENYKDMLKTSKEKNCIDKVDSESHKNYIIEIYEAKISELKTRVNAEKDSKLKAIEEFRALQQSLNESIQSTKSISELKLVADKNIEEMKIRINKQIEENKTLREDNANFKRKHEELEKRCDQGTKKIGKLLNHESVLHQKQLEQQKLYDDAKQEVAKLQEQQTALLANRRSSGGYSEQFRSATGSLESLTSSIEDQLRNDLMTAKENESLQRIRADRLEEAVSRLEEAITRFPKPANDILEKHNEKLEDQLALVREEAIVERQASRTAHLSLWKLEKQVDELNLDKKLVARRLDQADEKFRKLRGERDEFERIVQFNLTIIKSKEEKIGELQSEIIDLKNNLKKEHGMWENSELERMREKSEIIEYMSKVHQLESALDEQKHKAHAITERNDSLTFANERLFSEKAKEQIELCQSIDTINDLENELQTLQRNYTMLKEACTIMETQLNELETMYDAEIRQNKSNCEKNNDLWTQVRSRSEDITNLRQELNEQRSLKIAADTKCTQLEHELKLISSQLNTQNEKLVSQQVELSNKTSNLFAVQESVEVLTADITNLQRLHHNYEREMHILKEANSKVLTDLFMAKEETNNLSMERKDYKKENAELIRKVEQLIGTLSEHKNYYLHREIKSEATQAQYKKLISYLQQKVEDLSHKKKKSLADVLFGTNAGSKKENIPPNVIEDAPAYKRIQEDLRRERSRSQQLKEQLLKAKTDMRMLPSSYEAEETTVVDVLQQQITQKIEGQKKVMKRRSNLIHRFEMTLENNSYEYPFTPCLVCQKEILVGHPYWKCKECKTAVHRHCRSNVKTSCGGEEVINDIYHDAKLDVDDVDKNALMDVAGSISNEYSGDVILQGDESSLQVNCAYEVMENILLLGCETGLYSYNQQNKQVVPITGLNSVTYIAVNPNLSKSILIGSQGEHLYQCDLRHLQNRAQASLCLKPTLDATILELPISNHVSNDKWQYIAIHGNNNNLSEAIAIACTSSRLMIMRFDLPTSRFKPICALDTAMPVSSILFTRHTAIVCSDKYFEIDLNSLVAEEFLNESDPSIVLTQTCRPMSAFKINKQEILLCFNEFGVFIDEYGMRSRPDNIKWVKPPTEFAYRDPLLFIAYSNMVHVLRINKSYSNELAIKNDDSHNDIQALINLNSPKFIGNCGKLGILVATTTSDANEYDDVIAIDGVKALKSYMSNSLETLFSSLSSIPKEVGGSVETITTIENYL